MLKTEMCMQTCGYLHGVFDDSSDLQLLSSTDSNHTAPSWWHGGFDDISLAFPE